MLVGTPLNKTTLQENFDTIVIGSGISGLACAALLSKRGHKVLVLEQHYTAGGFTHTFTRKGFEWDVGIHYIGEVGRSDSAMRALFDEITDKKLKWNDMGEVYDRIFIGDHSYDFPKGRENLKRMLKENFPSESDAIDRYFEIVKSANLASGGYFLQKALPDFLAKLLDKVLTKNFYEYASKTTKKVLDALTQNEELKAVLTGQFGDYGLPPSKSSFSMHALVTKHYFNGGYYPVGGSSNIARFTVEGIESRGGQVVTQARVVEVCTQNNRATGVKLENGKIIHAKNIVSTVGVKNTYTKLLPTTLNEKFGFTKNLSKVKQSMGHHCLYIGLKGSAKELGLKTPNLWLYRDADHDRNIENYLSGKDRSEFPLVYISFPSAKDPEWDAKRPGKATIEMITLASFDEVEKWKDEAVKKRGADYSAIKEEISQKLLETLFKHFPQLRDKVEHYELSTPLSTRHYCDYEQGEIYGLDHDPTRFAQRWLRVPTPIKGLFLSGQDIASAGVGGALAAGALSAIYILGPLKGFSIAKMLAPKKRRPAEQAL